MVHLSKKPLKNEKITKVFRLFYEILKKSSNEEEFLDIIKEILSPAEQLMIAKRIAIVYLLLKDVTAEDIAEYLSVSKATVAKFNLLFEQKKESKLVGKIKKILRNEKISNFFEDLFANIFLQPGLRIGHWKLYTQHKLGQQDRKYIK